MEGKLIRNMQIRRFQNMIDKDEFEELAFDIGSAIIEDLIDLHMKGVDNISIEVIYKC